MKRINRRDSLLVLEDSDSMKQAMLTALKNVKNKAIETIFEDETPGFKNVDDALFDRLSNGKEKVHLSQFIVKMENQGIGRDDPRLKETMARMKKAQKQFSVKGKDVALDKETFKCCISQNMVLVKKVFDNDLVIPNFLHFTTLIDAIHEECKSNTSGKVATYIPQLARFSPDNWGTSVCTVDGQRYCRGEVKVPFCLQSMSKPLNYAIALSDPHSEVVHDFVGQEPSGGSFNEIKLNNKSQPHNPLINSGAICVASLIRNKSCIADRYDYVRTMYQKLAGNGFLGYNMSVYLSERQTADRNFALGHYMQENKCFPEGVSLKDTLEFYFQLCSVEVTCESGAVIAATLANGGICPMTGEEVLSPEAVRDTLSLMHSCGMYDYSGQFAFKVGLPGKSGVSGVILLVVPNVMGLCLWSPPLDSCGNSVRSIQFCELLVEKFNFHQFDHQHQRQSEKEDPRKSHTEVNTDRAFYTCIYAASKGNLKELKRMFLCGVDMGLKDYDGRTSLHLAAGEGHLECVKFLLDVCKVDHESQDRWGHTALQDAQMNQHADITEYIERYLEDLKNNGISGSANN